MFSHRTQWDLAPNALTRHLEARRHAGRPVLDLTESNPTRAGFDYAPDTLLPALIRPESLSYEPQAKGHARARRAIADYYKGRQIAVDPEQLLLTAGTSEAYSFLFRLLTEPGDKVLAPRPSYPLFDFLATLNDIRLEPYPLIYDQGWRIDLAALAAAVDSRTRAVMIVNPNNPTGSYLNREEFSALNAIARRQELALISDEVFCDYAFAPNPHRIESLTGNREALTFTLNGLSKMLGLPQMKLAWIAASGPAGLVDEAMSRLEVIADTYLSVNTPVQVAVPEWLHQRPSIQQQILTRVLRNREFLMSQVRRSALCECLEADGGWYGVVRVPRTRSEEEWVLELIDREGVLLHPGYFFDFMYEGYLVVSLLPPPEVFETGVTRMLARM